MTTTVTEAQLREKIVKNWRVNGPSRLPGGWSSWCQSLMHNIAEFAQDIPDGVTHPSAMHAYRASKIESTDPSKAPAGAAHFWADPDPDGHVAYDMDGGATRLLMASDYVTDSWALGAGTVSFVDYQRRSGNRYLGWSRTDGQFKLPVLAAAPVKKSPVQVIRDYGMAHADELVKAASAAGLPLWVAAAVIEKESNGANVFGHDAGGAFHGAGEVTEAKYRAFLGEVRGGKTSNGVGPAQITWPRFFDEAEKQGLKLWQPLDNMLYGFRLVAGYLGGDYSDAAIREAGKRYNGNGSYGDHLVQVAREWKSRLGGQTAEAAPGFVRAPGGEPGAPLWPVGPLMKRIQAALHARDRYDGEIDGVGAELTAKGIQITLNISEQNGVGREYVESPIDGALGENNAYGVQWYATAHGDYTGPVDGDPREQSWTGFALGLERP